MTQTAALFLDAYRELNARKLFWISLILSGLVVLAFALIGLTETGLKVIVWDIDFEFLNSKVLTPATFYKMTFTNIGIGVWLTWIATILALVSTASIFPDFISGGSIDLVLAKPIGRLRLFLTKYATGLLFVTLQVSVFTVACFLVIGFRGGVWEPALLLAIPLVVIFFSYLYAVCVLLGLLTRSTIAALLLTMLFWFLLFGIHATESVFLKLKVEAEQKITSLEKSIAKDETYLKRLTGSDANTDESFLEPVHARLGKKQTKLDNARESFANIDYGHNITLKVKTALPKTAETIELLERWLVDLADLKGFSDQADKNHDDDSLSEKSNPEDESFRPDPQSTQRALMEKLRSRSPWWIIGTSLLFELAILTLAARIFTRRDF